ncbi:TRAP transporter small permease [Microbaculum marinum]|uniref:TRAP transporter small permease protein n=1 Tax=Microbaculum marinum TaxID=1764581 RepID=A0AAW9RN42_9HYPH
MGQGNENDRARPHATSIAVEPEQTSIADIRWIDAPGILVFWVLAIVVFLQFFTRYVLNDSLAWTEEVARYLLILVCFLGSVSAVKRGSHIALEFLMRMVPPACAKALSVVSAVITCGIYGTLTWIGIELTQKTRQKMVTLPVPKAWIYTICVVALAVMTAYAAVWAWRKLRRSPGQLVADLDRHLTTD